MTGFLTFGISLIFALQNFGLNVDCFTPLPNDQMTVDFYDMSIHQVYRKIQTMINTNKYEGALPLLWKGYKLLEKIYGEDHAKTLDILTELGKIYMERHKFEKAEEILKRAYRLTKAKLGQNHQNTIEILYYLAQLYRTSSSRNPDLSSDSDPKRLGLTLRYYRKVYDVWSKDPQFQTGEKYEETLEVLKHIGNILFLQNEFLEAAEIYQQVFDAKTQLLGEDHPDTQEVQRSIFFALTNAGQTREAREVLGKEHLQKHEENDDEILFSLVTSKAKALAAKGKHAQALEIVRELYDLELLKPQPKLSPQIIGILDKLISYSEILGDFEQTLKWANVIFDLGQKQRILINGEPDGLNLASLQLYSLELSIRVCSEQSDEDKVEEYFKTAGETFLPFQHSIALLEKYFDVVKRVADFKAKIGKLDEAFALYQDLAQNPHHSRIASVASSTMAQIMQIMQENGGCNV